MNTKVLMLGGHLCGKTSALASMFDELLEGPFNKYITVVDCTLYTDNMGQTLNAKRLLNRLYITKRPQSVFSIESGADNSIFEYKLKVITDDCRKSVYIDFIDIPGSMMKNVEPFLPQIKTLTQECDSILVFIDTPYLMECSEAISEAVNTVHEIFDLLSSIECNTIASSKSVFFVPVKCEKWIHEGKTNEVIDKIKHTYRNVIKCLTSTKYISVGIIPIQTLGSIEFVEMSDSYLIQGDNFKQGSRLSEKLFRMTDGRMVRLKPEEETYLDHTRMLGCDMYKPIAWFKVASDANKHIALNSCDQLFFHMLKFYADKLASQPKGFMHYFFPPHWLDLDKELHKLLHQLESDGYFKPNDDRIEYIKTII